MKKSIPILFAILFVFMAIIAFCNGSQTNIYTTITAVIALGLSLFSFYFQYFYNIHKLSFSLVDLAFNGNAMDAYCTFENTGTNEEIIIGATFIFPQSPTNTYSTITRNAGHDLLPELLEPFILQPANIKLKHFHWEIGFKDLLTHFHIKNGEKFEQVIHLKIDFINPITRSKAVQHINIGTIRFYNDFASFSQMHYSQHQLFEGK